MSKITFILILLILQFNNCIKKGDDKTTNHSESNHEKHIIPKHQLDSAYIDTVVSIGDNLCIINNKYLGFYDDSFQIGRKMKFSKCSLNLGKWRIYGLRDSFFTLITTTSEKSKSNGRSCMSNISINPIELTYNNSNRFQDTIAYLFTAIYDYDTTYCNLRHGDLLKDVIYGGILFLNKNEHWDFSKIRRVNLDKNIGIKNCPENDLYRSMDNLFSYSFSDLCNYYLYGTYIKCK